MNKKIIYFTIIVIILSIFSYNNINQLIIKNKIKSLDNNIIFEGSEINLSSLNTKQKIAQMIMVRGDKKDLLFNKQLVGGIFLDRQDSAEDYNNLISEYQNDSKISLFVATDLEGAWTPFRNPTPEQNFPFFSEIKTKEEAKEIGIKHGKLLNETGFNLNFAPVAEYSDNAYGGRTFTGTKKEVSEKVVFYLNGLQSEVMGTCKHYPGKAMGKNLHLVSNTVELTSEDLDIFNECIKNNVSSIMVSHQIATGAINSNGKPSSVSKEVIDNLDESVLVIADEINMVGLSGFYSSKVDLYEDLINSGEELILDFSLNSVELYLLIEEIEKRVNEGSINENLINDAVTKILEKKGYTVT